MTFCKGSLSSTWSPGCLLRFPLSRKWSFNAVILVLWLIYHTHLTPQHSFEGTWRGRAPLVSKIIPHIRSIATVSWIWHRFEDCIFSFHQLCDLCGDVDVCTDVFVYCHHTHISSFDQCTHLKKLIRPKKLLRLILGEHQEDIPQLTDSFLTSHLVSY